MDSLFPTAKIYSPQGQKYEAVDRELLLSYKEATDGVILHEGISEAGAMGSVTAAGTSYATHGTPMIPVYVFYSMFGFQRTGDQMWAFGDQLGRGFLLGATAGRTTLNGEGLQHQDGHSLLLAASNPACVAYDPAFSFELSHIMKEALDRMYGERDESVFYYLTLYNEPFPQPAEPEGIDIDGLLRGLYRFRAAEPVEGERPSVSILASGSALLAAQRAQQLLAEDWNVAADLWSATSWNELHRDGVACEQHNLLHPDEPAKVPFVTSALTGAPVVAVSDFQRAVPDLIARWVPGGLHLPRHRWLRQIGHAGGAASLVSRRRAVHHHRRAGDAEQTRRSRSGDGEGGHRSLRLRHRASRSRVCERRRRRAGQWVARLLTQNAPSLSATDGDGAFALWAGLAQGAHVMRSVRIP